MNWSDKQREAIRCRGKNLLVSASAGSGKTAVLVERIVNLCVEDQVDIDKFLVVTFTKAAAAEMRNRISKRLIELKSEGIHVRFINRQLSLLQNANISTLHSFCNNVIRSNFYELNIDPNFKIADDRSLKMLSQKALDEVLSLYYSGANEFFGEANSSIRHLSDEREHAELRKMMADIRIDDEDIRRFSAFSDSYFHYKNDDGLKNAILSLYEFAMAQPHPLKWLGSAKEHDLKELYLKVFERFKEDLKNWIRDLQTCFLLCNEKNGLQRYAEAIIDDYTKFYDILKEVDAFIEKKAVFLSRDSELNPSVTEDHSNFEHDCETLLRKITSFDKYVRFSAVKKEEADPDVQQFVKRMREIVKEEFKYYKEHFFSLTCAATSDQMGKIKPHISIFSKLAMDYHKRFRDLKKDEKVLDFHDLEHFCIEIFQNPDIANSYRKNLKYIFVDEYQDTNAVQEEITNLIKSDDNLFFVGDVKQSIYGFRMAEPQLFLDKFHLYASGDRHHRIDLNGNYRSSPSILSGINHIFDSLMREEFGGLEYRESARLEAGRRDFEMIEKPGFHLIAPKNDDADLCEVEAHFIASQIEEILKIPIYDSKKGICRLPELNDIVILMRSVKDDAKKMQNVLLKRGFASVSSEESSFFDVPEVLNLINMLKIIDNPYEDIALLGVMRSIFGQFSDTELALIRSESEKGEFFYDDVESYIQAHEDELSKKLESFVFKLERYRKEHYKSLSELADLILEEHQYRYFVSSLNNAEIRLRYLEAFYQKILEYQNSNPSILYQFVDHIDRIRSMGIDYKSESGSSNEQQAIRIMSIHKSKGLEFPIVFVARLAKRFNMIDLKQNILYDKSIHISMRHLDKKGYTKSDTLIYEYVKSKTEKKLIEEEQRLLYVALTRAVNRLECIVSFKDEENLEKFYSIYHRPFLQREYMHDSVHAEFWKALSYDLDEDLVLLSDLKKSNSYAQFIANSLNFSGDDWRIRKVLIEDSQPQLIEGRGQIPDLCSIINSNEILPYKEYVKDYSFIPKKQGVTSFIKASKGELISPEVPFVKNDLQNEEPIERDIIQEERCLKNETNDDAMMRGSAYHKAIEMLIRALIDSEFSLDLQDNLQIRRILEGAVEREHLNREFYDLIDVEKLSRLFSEEFLMKVKSSDYIFPEKSFVYQYQNEEHDVLLQGVVDLLLIGKDGMTLIDYKTDNISLEGLKKRYQMQIDLYAEALEGILKKKVLNKLLYSIELGKFIVV